MLSERLQHLRKQKDITQEEIAKYIGVTRPAYSAYEGGKRTPDYNTLQKLADYFNVTTDYLLGRTVNPAPPDKITSSISDDSELIEFWDKLKEREDLQIFFKQTKDMSPADIKKIMRIIKAIEDEEANDDSL